MNVRSKIIYVCMLFMGSISFSITAAHENDHPFQILRNTRLSQKDKNRQLFEAVVNDDVNSAASLLQAGASVDAEHLVGYDWKPEGGITALFYPPTQGNQQTITPLGFAAYKNSVSMVTYLLNLSKHNENTIKRAIMVAAYYGRDSVIPSLCQNLLDNKPPYKSKERVLKDLYAPLKQAVSARHNKVVSIFLTQGVPLYSADVTEFTLFHRAVETRNNEVLEQLLDHEYKDALNIREKLSNSWQQKLVHVFSNKRQFIALPSTEKTNQHGITALAYAQVELERENDGEGQHSLQQSITLLQQQRVRQTSLNNESEQKEAHNS